MPCPVVSIIVPIFNSEEGLGACLESILAQKYMEFELILVNDGSTDNSEPICRKFAELDSRIVMLKQNNRGVSAARNRGLAAARGIYIMFIDSDDRVEASMLDVMLRAVRENRADLAICGIRWLTKKGKGEETADYPLPDKQYDANSLLESMNNEFENQCLFGACAKLYCLEIIRQHNLHFDERKTMLEDAVFVMHYLAHCLRIATVRDVLYHYHRGNPSSLAGRSRPNAMQIRVDAFAVIRETYMEQGYSRQARLNLEYVYIHSLLMGMKEELLLQSGTRRKWLESRKAAKRIVYDPSILDTVAFIRRRNTLDWLLLVLIQYRFFRLLSAAIALAVAVHFRGKSRGIAAQALP